MTGTAGSVAAPARHREVSWEDPLVGAALAAGLSGLDYLRGIAEGRIPPAPIAVLLGMTVVRVDRGEVTSGLDVGEHLYNPIGSVHGGVFCTLLDSAMGCAVVMDTQPAAQAAPGPDAPSSAESGQGNSNGR